MQPPGRTASGGALAPQQPRAPQNQLQSILIFAENPYFFDFWAQKKPRLNKPPARRNSARRIGNCRRFVEPGSFLTLSIRHCEERNWVELAQLELFEKKIEFSRLNTICGNNKVIHRPNRNFIQGKFGLSRLNPNFGRQIGLSRLNSIFEKEKGWGGITRILQK